MQELYLSEVEVNRAVENKSLDFPIRQLIVTIVSKKG